MKKFRFGSVTVFRIMVVCLVMSGTSYAQESREVEANAQVGIVSGIGTHASFGGNIGMALGPRIRGYGEFSYIPLGGSSTSIPGVGQAEAGARAYNFNLTGEYQFSRSRSSLLEPYAAFGLGLLRTSSSYSTSVGGMTVSGETSSKDLYFNIGGGLRYFVDERWGLRPELMIFAGSNTYVRLGAGIFYRFGR
jgi:hypothetical protein